MNPVDRLEKNMESFTKSEKRIASYIVEDPILVVQLTAEELAKEAGSSKTAFIRLCQKIGYQGYSEFRFSLSKFLVSHKTENEEELPIIQSLTSVYSDHIRQIAQTVTEKEHKAFCRLIGESNRIKIFGYNRTGMAAQQLRMRMAKIGYDCEYTTDLLLMKDIVNSLKENDLVIIFTIKGSSYYDDIVKQFKMNQATGVLITMNPSTPLSREVDLTINLPLVSRSTTHFLDDQAVFFVYIEILLAGLAELD
ncbi:MurR/RpiR family transcriptional regulator [Marinilactibacillus kalidii]|uniref:MurR/RpiR family transcriptional regulator n=1 Tax=Marinilactibacillus kalidii TaxID=2820274 RepID=UPI001ABE0641|nr:MurR/RpiR family transcriptional regulator [Marinilactibacillus kalidii]